MQLGVFMENRIKLERMMKVVKRAQEGPICSERDFDLKVLAPKLNEILKEYDIKFDPKIVVPSDNSLADDVFEAALDLYCHTGTYCMTTRRRIIFEENEIKEALKNPPKQVTFGEGKEERVMTYRRIGDQKRPFCFTSGGCQVSEDVYVKLIQSYVQNPLADTASGGFPLNTIFGVMPKVGSPTEIFASIWNVILMKEGARRAGRPNMGVHNILGSALSDAAFIAAVKSEFGVRPVDGVLIASMSELKTDYSQLNKAAYFIQCNQNLGGVYVPLVRGISGGPEGTAVVTLAHHLQGLLIHQVDYSDFPPLDLRYSCSTTRESLWVASIVGQALSRNTRLLTACEAITAAGPCTNMVLDEIAAMSIVGAASGIHINNASAAKSQYLDRNTGMEGRVGCEVGYAAAGMKRDAANDFVNRLLASYESELVNPPLGLRFQECYDLTTVKPAQKYVEIHDNFINKLENLGLNFKGIDVHI